MLDDG